MAPFQERNDWSVQCGFFSSGVELVLDFTSQTDIF